MKDLTIKELIAELQKYPNQDASINIVTNLVNTDDDAYDVENCEIDFFQQDVEDALSYDLFISRPQEERKAMEENIENSISNLLDENERLTIQLDIFDEHSNIVITNDYGDVLREIAVGGRHYQYQNIVKMLGFIL